MAQKEINIKVKTDTSEVTESVKSLKQQFREAQLEAQKLAAADVIDQKALDAAIAKTAELKDRMNDVNEQIAVLSAGSPFEKMANGLGDVGSKIASLDFEGAKESAGKLITISKSITFGEAIKGVKDLGSTFLQLGKALLTNPLFLIGAAIALLVMGIIKLMDKLGLLKVITKAIGDIFDWLMIPINAIIDGLKALTDWFGWTNNAATDAAKEMAENAEKTAAAYEEKSKTVVQSLDNEIRMAELNGESTRKAELKKAYWILNTAKQRAKADIAAYQSAKLQGDLDEEELKALEDKYKASKLASDQAVSDVKYLKAKFRKEDADAQKKADEDEKKANEDKNKKIADANKKAADEYRKKREEERKARLEADRYLIDLTLQNMQDGVEKEIAINNEKYKRLLDANLKNALITAEQRKAINDQLLIQQANEETKIKEAENQKKLDAEKAFLQQLAEVNADVNASRLQQLDNAYAQEIAKLDEQLKNKAITQEQYNQLELAYKDKLQADKEALDAEYAMRDRIATASMMEDGLAKKLEQIAIAREQELAALDLTEQEKKAIEEKYRAEREAAEEEEANKRVERAMKTGMATLDATKGALQGVSDLVGAFAGKSEAAQKRAFEVQKKLNIAMAVIDTIKGAVSAVTGMISTIPGPVGIALGAVAAAGVVASGVANVAKIKATKFEGSGSPNAATPSTGGASSATPATPSFNLFGTPNQGNNATSTQSAEAKQPTLNVNASVSVDEITNTQKKMTKINESASL